MTNEEAINIMSQMIKDEEGFLSDNTVEAHKMAIKALEQESSEDCISRENTLKAMIEQLGIRNEDYLIPAEATLYKVVKNMPPVTPQPKTGYWIDADGDNAICGCCNRLNHLYGTYCKHCGARMVETQESEV